MADDGLDHGPSERGGGRWIFWLILAAVAFVGGGVFFHMSTQNASRYFVQVRDGSLVVRRGIFFPTGAADFDGGGHYAPVVLAEGVSVPEATGEALPDLATVDGMLYGVFVRMARTAIEEGGKAPLAQAHELLRRARILPHVSEEQLDEVLRYKGDIALAEGKLAILEVGGLLSAARERMQQAEERGTRIYRNPSGWIAWIDRKLEEMQAVADRKDPPEDACPPVAAAPPVPAAAAAPPFGTAPGTGTGTDMLFPPTPPGVAPPAEAGPAGDEGAPTDDEADPADEPDDGKPWDPSQKGAAPPDGADDGGADDSAPARDGVPAEPASGDKPLPEKVRL